MKSPQYVCCPLTDRPNPDISFTTLLAIISTEVSLDFGEQGYVLLEMGNTVTYIVMARYIYSKDIIKNILLKTINLK